MIDNKSNYFVPPVGLINLSRKDQKNFIKGNNSNLYNTCYINSVIQCLFRLNEFIEKIMNFQRGKLVEATKNLINAMQNKFKYKFLSVSEIKEAMIEYDEKYYSINPEDANEFITDYLDGLLEETRINQNIIKEIKINNIMDKNYFHFLERFNKNGVSFISDLFYGILKTENKCRKCGNSISIKYHPFNILDLPLYNLIKNKENNTLEITDIITEFISEKEVLNIQCKSCNINIISKTNFYRIPKYMILYFERNYNNYIKNKINILETINFNYFLENNESKKTLYDIKGIIYYSFLKDNKKHYSSSCLLENSWYYFDDNRYINTKKFLQYEDEYPVLLFYEQKE